jgi:hypothetical protein
VYLWSLGLALCIFKAELLLLYCLQGQESETITIEGFLPWTVSNKLMLPYVSIIAHCPEAVAISSLQVAPRACASKINLDIQLPRAKILQASSLAQLRTHLYTIICIPFNVHPLGQRSLGDFLGPDLVIFLICIVVVCKLLQTPRGSDQRPDPPSPFFSMRAAPSRT